MSGATTFSNLTIPVDQFLALINASNPSASNPFVTINDLLTGVNPVVVANYSALPSPSSVAGSFYWVENSQGTWWLPLSLGGTFYAAGLYYSNGTSWITSPIPWQATLTEVNSGTNNDTFVTPYTFENASKWGSKYDSSNPDNYQTETEVDNKILAHESASDPHPQYAQNLDELTDVTITNPQTNEVLKFNGVEWINQSSDPVVNAGAGVTYFLGSTASGIGSYDLMSKTPDGGLETIETASLLNNTVLIDGYISDSPINANNIDAGIWEFNYFTFLDSTAGHTFIRTEVYKITTSNTETLLFTVDSEEINHTVVSAIPTVSTVQPSFVCNTTDKLLVKIYGSTNSGSSVVVSLVHSGSEHYSHFHTPLVTRHNDLANLQGGASGEYYHLTLAQLNSLGLKEETTNKGVPNGYAPLDASSLLPAINSRPSSVSYNNVTGVLSFTWADGSSQSIDLPIENLLQSASYNSSTQTLTVTTNGGGSIDIDLSALVDLPEIVLSPSSNPATTPTTGQKLFIRQDNGAYWTNSSGTWVGGYLGVTSAEKTTWNNKYDSSNPNGYETPSQLNTRDTNNRNRANHSGTQTASTISDFATTVLNTVLTGLGTFTNTTIISTDTLLQALAKLQGQINNKANISGQTFTGPISATNLSGTNDGDETTLSIQTKRPLKTVNGNSLEGTGDITISGGGGSGLTFNESLRLRTILTN